MIPSLVTFGCSLTYQQGWAQYIAKKLDRKLINFAVGASSNHTQMFRFKDWFLNNDNADTIIIWQITYLSRFGIRYAPNHPDISTINDHENTVQKYKSKYENPLDGENHIDIMSGNPYLEQFERYRNIEQDLLDLLFCMKVANGSSKKLFVFYGDEIADKSLMESYSDLLDKHRIHNTRTAMVSWCRSNSLAFDPVNHHPKRESYESYAATFILPNLKEK